jgi:hypothetical protein
MTTGTSMKSTRYRHGLLCESDGLVTVDRNIISTTNRCVALFIPHMKSIKSTVTDLINALSGNSSVNTVQHATIEEAVFSMSSGPSSGGTTGLCNLFLNNGPVNTLPPKR